MRTITVRTDKGVADVRTKNRRTRILRAKYLAALRKQYPNLAAYEIELAAIPIPPQPRNEMMRAKYEEDMREYIAKSRVVAAKHAEGFMLYDDAGVVSTLLSRICHTQGFTFVADSLGEFSSTSVVAAFEEYLNDDEDENSIWSKVSSAIAELDEPITSVVDRPPETLTDEERNDPKSVAADPSDRSRLSGISTIS